MSARPLLTVVTVFWNGAEDAVRFFTALHEAAERLPFRVETIAVDNASSDGTPDLIAQRFPWVRLIRNTENVGFAPACNQGLEVARGHLLLLLNPDCEADAEALAGMCRYLMSHPRAGAAGCALLHGDGLPQNSWHDEPSWCAYWAGHSLASPLLLTITKRLHCLRGRDCRARRVDWLMGACLMVPRTVWERVGGLDPTYFMYSEDADWCRRIRDAGYTVVHLPRWSIVHHHGTTARRRPEFTFRRLYRSLLMYGRKHHGPVALLALRAAVVTDMLLRWPIYAVQNDGPRLDSVRRVLAMYVHNDPSLGNDAPD